MKRIYDTGSDNYFYKHGQTGTSEHKSWMMMMHRCYGSKPGQKNFYLYREAGIIVASRWHDFTNFLADMGEKPSPQHSIDRYPDPVGNYEPTNCRWATAKEQANNRRNNRRLEFRGENLTLPEWASRLGISRTSLRDRLNAGWPIERALTTPGIRNGKQE